MNRGFSSVTLIITLIILTVVGGSFIYKNTIETSKPISVGISSQSTTTAEGKGLDVESLIKSEGNDGPLSNSDSAGQADRDTETEDRGGFFSGIIDRVASSIENKEPEVPVQSEEDDESDTDIITDVIDEINTEELFEEKPVEKTFKPGDVKWVHNIGSSIYSSPALGNDGTIYIGADDKKLHAINSDGSKKWSFETEGRISSEPTIDKNGVVYFGSHDSNLYAINKDGTEKWSLVVGKVEGSPAIGSDGTVYVGSLDGSIFYLRAIDSGGKIKWSRVIDSTGNHPPSVGSDGRIYATGRTGNKYTIKSYNPDGGSSWSSDIGDRSNFTPVVMYDSEFDVDVVYAGTSSKFVAVHSFPTQGLKKWEFQTGSRSYLPSVATDGTIYFGAENKKIYALHQGKLNNSSLKWTFSVVGVPYSTPLVGADGIIYVGTEGVEGRLYAINPDGTENWSYVIVDGTHSSPAIAEDGTVYIGSIDGNVYAFQSSSSGLANSQWPKFGHDNQNTGRSD